MHVRPDDDEREEQDRTAPRHGPGLAQQRDEQHERQIHQALSAHARSGGSERQQPKKRDERDRRRLPPTSPTVDAGGDERPDNEEHVEADDEPNAADDVDAVDRQAGRAIAGRPILALPSEPQGCRGAAGRGAR